MHKPAETEDSHVYGYVQFDTDVNELVSRYVKAGLGARQLREVLQTQVAYLDEYLKQDLVERVEKARGRRVI